MTTPGSSTCMDEALRTGDRQVFAEAVGMGKSTLEKCWREGEDGGLLGLDYPGQPLEQSADSPSAERLEDTLVFLLLTIEHTQADWAVEWYDKVLGLAHSRPEQLNRRSLLHHPRRLFLSIDMLKGIIARQGRASAVLDASRD
ncbi:hypothetical protein ACFL6X_09425 [Candidatus Latescibacterota bacterium]